RRVGHSREEQDPLSGGRGVDTSPARTGIPVFLHTVPEVAGHGENRLRDAQRAAARRRAAVQGGHIPGGDRLGRGAGALVHPGGGEPWVRGRLPRDICPGTTDYTDLILGARAAEVQALLSLPTPPD